jgi:NAD-dependent SIR2 family protein deacetylase
MNRVSPVGGLAQTAERVARWIREADRVVIGAGSGLSAAGGLDFGDEEDFAARFPALVRRGLRAAYQMIGYSELSEAAFWGFWSVHVMQMRFADGRSPIYETLLRLVREKDCFVLTTNVDAMFVRNGFDPERVWSIQGDYAFLQCLRPCATEVWPSAPPLQRALAAIDPVTQEVADPACVPRCNTCGGNVFMNVRGGDWFLEEPYEAQRERWRRWFGGIRCGERLLLLDIGSGFNTPSLVRWPMERLALRDPVARIVRINLHHADLPRELGSRGLSVAAGAREALAAIVAVVEDAARADDAAGIHSLNIQSTPLTG